MFSHCLAKSINSQRPDISFNSFFFSFFSQILLPLPCRSMYIILPLSNNNRGLHVIKPDEGFGWRNNFAHNPSIGGHPAFTVKDLSALKKRLDNEDILYSDAKVYAMPGFHQIYLYDINANMLEVNQAV